LQWKYHFSKSARLERANIAARYETLKTQINPHFLFNSLNSLTSLVDGNPAAVGYISNLSDLLRYMLKSNEKELVLLREEIGVLNNYVSLQQMRYKENLNITIDLPESYYHYALPPLSLQMLVENAIKHNIITRDKPLTIKIWAEKGLLVVENNLQRRETTENTNRGLKNIRERFAHFTTRGITIDESNGFFRVTLPLLQVEL
jgi:two-component system, LytTR family, sensor kinase